MNKEKKNILPQAKAYADGLDEMKKTASWSEAEVEDYIVTVLAEKADGWYIPEDDTKLTWLSADKDANQHVEVVVRDKQDGRFIPELMVSLRLYDDAGRMVDDMVQPFSWHPLIFHYGVNWTIPKGGYYIPEVLIEQPIFGRHGKNNGNRYPAKVVVRLKAIEMKPGRK